MLGIVQECQTMLCAGAKHCKNHDRRRTSCVNAYFGKRRVLPGDVGVQEPRQHCRAAFFCSGRLCGLPYGPGLETRAESSPLATVRTRTLPRPSCYVKIHTQTHPPTSRVLFVGVRKRSVLVHSIAVITYSKPASHAYRTSASEPLARAGCGAEAAHNSAGSCFAQEAMHVYLEHRQRSPSRARDFQVLHSFSKVVFE